VKIHLHISNLDPGGAQKVMISLANTWQEEGHQISLSANSVNGYWRSAIDPSIQIVDLRAQNLLRAVPPLRKALVNLRPNVILSAMTQANITAAIAGKLTGTPCVLSERHHTTTWMKRLSPLKRVVYKSLLPLAYTQADALIALTAGSARDLCTVTKQPTEAVFVIPNPVTNSPDVSAEAPHPWLEDAEIPVVVGVGRLVSQKDFATLIQAVAALAKHRLARLIILGDGPLLATLTNLVRSQGLEDIVFFAGHVSNVQDYIARAKVYALSSNFEGFPNALLEALASGTPVVSTDCPTGPREILEDGKYGGLVPVGDSNALGQAIEQALDHPCDPKILKKRAADFDLKAISGSYLDALKHGMSHSS